MEIRGKSRSVNPYVHLVHSKENKNPRTESELIRSGASSSKHPSPFSIFPDGCRLGLCFFFNVFLDLIVLIFVIFFSWLFRLMY